MITLYRKQEKKNECLSGFAEFSLNNFLTPFMLCMSAQPNIDKSIYGIIRQGAEAARVCTTQEFAAGYKVEEMPINFLGVRFVKDEQYSDMAMELVDKYIYPYLTMNGKDVDNLIKRARLMNFMTYCDGTYTFKKIDSNIKERLLSEGLSNEDVLKVLKEMKLVAIGTINDTSTLDVTSIVLADVNDTEIENKRTEVVKKNLETTNKQGIHGHFGDSTNGFYYYKGTGVHELKEYFKDSALVKPVLCCVVSKFIEGSINNKSIDLNELLSLMKKYSNEEVANKDKLAEIDSNINYGDVPKYTSNDYEIRTQFDKACSSLLESQRKLEFANNIVEQKKEREALLIECIKQYSSDITLAQILAAAKVWQSPEGMDPFKIPSDRLIRAKLDELGLTEKINQSLVANDGPDNSAPKM